MAGRESCICSQFLQNYQQNTINPNAGAQGRLKYYYLATQILRLNAENNMNPNVGRQKTKLRPKNKTSVPEFRSEEKSNNLTQIQAQKKQTKCKTVSYKQARKPYSYTSLKLC